MPFTTDLVAKQVGDDDWELVEPLEYRGNKEKFRVPPGSKTDFASVPILFRWLIPRSGRHTKAAVLHDHLWRTHLCSYHDADGLFRRALHDLDVPFLRRWIMWAAVRWASLWRSKFGDGLGELPQVILVTIFPGLFVIATGLVVLAFLETFALFELLASIPIGLARLLGFEKVKPYRPPAVIGHSRKRAA